MVMLTGTVSYNSIFTLNKAYADPPVGVAVDPSGNVFVVEPENDRIHKFTNTGTFIKKWGKEGSGNGEFAVDIC
jgi:tripartite motif-containing protein 71